MATHLLAEVQLFALPKCFGWCGHSPETPHTSQSPYSHWRVVLLEISTLSKPEAILCLVIFCELFEFSKFLAVGVQVREVLLRMCRIW